MSAALPVEARLAETMAALEAMGTEQTRKTFRRHGAPENQFGVKIGDMKTLLKGRKGDQELALALYDTGNSDAQYFAGLLANPKKLSAETLQHWAETALWHMQAEYTVAWNAAESPHGWTLGLRWINDDRELVASAGWATLACWVQLVPDDQLDLDALRGLLDSIPGRMAGAKNRVRYTMNGFVIAVAGGVGQLVKEAEAVAKRLGKVEVDVGDTDCKIPLATEYIAKLVNGGHVGRKRKTVKC